MSRRRAIDEGPSWPWVCAGADLWRLRHDLELIDRFGALAVRGSEAICTGVSPADDHHMPASSRNLDLIDCPVALLGFVGHWQDFHGLVNPLKFATGNRKIASKRCASCNNYCIEVFLEFSHTDVDTNIDIHAELGSFCSHLREATVKNTLFHLELWDAVTQQSTDSVCALKHDHRVPCPSELLRHCKACGPRADHGHFLVSQTCRPHCMHPALFPRMIDDRNLNLLDRDGVRVDSQYAGRLTWCGAQPSGELGEVIGGV
ncbi:unannotated protein [freshwater metagenome]|uniref:Unannotated protein n=1 Tax=freshwater metagenome TaxID=449393 RepID=A0A6J7HH89_9ZZZZ